MLSSPLKLIHSIGAGIEGIMADAALPDVPVCRIVDPKLALAMGEYVLWGTLYFHRQFDVVVANSQKGEWHRLEQKAAEDVRVGLMGLGTMGEAAARLLVAAGYQVFGWSRGAKELPGVTTYSGEAGLKPFLEQSDILACLLPLTPETRGILNARTFQTMPKGASLILCSRGEHLVIDDLVAALRSGHLRGAILDVFAQEPLAPGHMLWREPGVLITPHMAGLAKPRAIATQIAENIRRLQTGEPLLNRVDTARGY